MSITKGQVADLRVGDVVEVVQRERITIAQVVDGEAFPYIGDGSDPDLLSLTVVSRAPRPLYGNHDRTEPEPGDVVRDGEGRVWLMDSFKTWQGTDSTCEQANQHTGLEQPLTLLVDGATGQVVR